MTQATALELTMPRLSDSMEEGTILTWRVQPGDQVEVGQEIAEIETDKANMAYESELAGTVLELLVQENETAAVGAVIALVGEPGGSPQPPPPRPGGDRADSPSPPQVPSRAADGSGSDSARARAKASPLARRLAKELGVHMSGLLGTGPGGRIVRRDVEAAASAAAPSISTAVSHQPAVSPPGNGSREPTAKGDVALQELTKLQEVVARRMSESKATAPHFYLTAEVDMTAAVRARAALKASSGEGAVVPSINDMVVKACALALTEFPKANGSYRDGRFELHSRVNIGIAVAAEGSLVVPTVFDADRKGLRQIAAEARALAAKVREGLITPPELAGGTFTVSNLGMFGIEEFGAVINQPQAGILAVGAVREAPGRRQKCFSKRVNAGSVLRPRWRTVSRSRRSGATRSRSSTAAKPRTFS